MSLAIQLGKLLSQGHEMFALDKRSKQHKVVATVDGEHYEIAK
jgi:hypothetical protein